MLFTRTDPKKVMEAQLYEAERHAIEHEAAAEHHDALATMYRGRVARLKEALGHDRKQPGVNGMDWPSLQKGGAA